ncbi:MAG: redoxin domain-containing protein [Planctomycetota bacterium]
MRRRSYQTRRTGRGGRLLRGVRRFAFMAITTAFVSCDPIDPPEPGANLVGTKASEWVGSVRWIGDASPSLADLRGRVVLVRWWTDRCALCVRSIPVLNVLDEEFRDAGLSIVGFYHPKPFPRRVGDAEVMRAALPLNMTFPVGVDAEWKLLQRWWLRPPLPRFTSVSFLIDHRGIIRWVHTGGEYHPSADPKHAACDASYRELVHLIPELLRERRAVGSAR